MRHKYSPTFPILLTFGFDALESRLKAVQVPVRFTRAGESGLFKLSFSWWSTDLYQTASCPYGDQMGDGATEGGIAHPYNFIEFKSSIRHVYLQDKRDYRNEKKTTIATKHID